MQIELPLPGGGNVPGVASPVKFSHTPIEYSAAPPALGQHTDQILSALGLSEADIAQLKAGKVIA